MGAVGNASWTPSGKTVGTSMANGTEQGMLDGYVVSIQHHTELPASDSRPHVGSVVGDRYRLDEPMTLWLRRARGRLPNAKLESVDASTCSQQQFTEWLYFIRNTRDYVAVTRDESKAA